MLKEVRNGNELNISFSKYLHFILVSTPLRKSYPWWTVIEMQTKIQKCQITVNDKWSSMHCYPLICFRLSQATKLKISFILFLISISFIPCISLSSYVMNRDPQFRAEEKGERRILQFPTEKMSIICCILEFKGNYIW